MVRSDKWTFVIQWHSWVKFLLFYHYMEMTYTLAIFMSLCFSCKNKKTIPPLFFFQIISQLCFPRSSKRDLCTASCVWIISWSVGLKLAWNPSHLSFDFLCEGKYHCKTMQLVPITISEASLDGQSRRCLMSTSLSSNSFASSVLQTSDVKRDMFPSSFQKIAL